MNLRQKSTIATILAASGSDAFVLPTKYATPTSLSLKPDAFYISEPLQEVSDLIEKAIAIQPLTSSAVEEDGAFVLEEEFECLEADALMEKATALEADAKAWEAEADALEEQAMMLEEKAAVVVEKEAVQVVSLQTRLEGGAQMSLREMVDRMNAPTLVEEEPVMEEEVHVIASVEEEAEQVEEDMEVTGSTTTSLEEDLENRRVRRMSLRERLEEMNNGSAPVPQEQQQEVVSLKEEEEVEEVAPLPEPVMAMKIEEVKIEEQKKPETMTKTMSLKERLSMIEQKLS